MKGRKTKTRYLSSINSKQYADIFLNQVQSIKCNILFLLKSNTTNHTALGMSEILKEYGFTINIFSFDQNILNGKKLKNLIDLKVVIENSDFVIDSVLGTDSSVALSQEMIEVFEYIQKSAKKVVSLESPSGVNVVTGNIAKGTLKANFTICCKAQCGFFYFPAREYIGKLISLNNSISTNPNITQINEQIIEQVKPKRPLDAHKGTFGKVFLLGGSTSYPGSILLSASSAYRAGCGLATIVTEESLLNIYASSLSESTYITYSLQDDISKIIDKIFVSSLEYDAILLGPGMGLTQTTRNIFFGVLRLLKSLQSSPNLVVDADGLTMLSMHPEWWNLLPSNTILTPHPGEMKKLCGIEFKPNSIEALNLALNMSKKWDKTIVLKQACSIIASSSGENYISFKTNPLLSTAGSGDVLSGIIAGLLGQGLSLINAATLGVEMHIRAADILSKNGSIKFGMLASDLLAVINQTI